MPRKYTKKTTRQFGKIPLKDIFDAWKGPFSIRKAAKEFNTPTMTLMDCIKRSRKGGSLEFSEPAFTKSRIVFTEEMETILSEYLKMAAKMYHGLTPVQAKILAYDFAKGRGMSYPLSWGEMEWQEKTGSQDLWSAR